ncbi:MAG: hypothetical protein ACYCW6_01840 [Candidatus Xenobia bacterium]
MPHCSACGRYSQSLTLCDICGRPLGSTPESVAHMEAAVAEINDILATQDWSLAMERCLVAQQMLVAEPSEHPRVMKARENLQRAIDVLAKKGVRPSHIVPGASLSIDRQAPGMLAGLAWVAVITGAFMCSGGLITVMNGETDGAWLAGLGLLLAVVGFFQRQWHWWAWMVYLGVNVLAAVGGVAWAVQATSMLDVGRAVIIALACALIATFIACHLGPLRNQRSH